MGNKTSANSHVGGRQWCGTGGTTVLMNAVDEETSGERTTCHDGVAAEGRVRVNVICGQNKMAHGNINTSKEENIQTPEPDDCRNNAQ